MNYSKEEIKRIQEKSLEMVLYFKNICEENHLLFYLCGGCCIGAIRNQGFIPWDDDVDVFMPRSDYEKLKKIWDEKADTNRYSLVDSNEDYIDHNLFLNIRDNETTFIRPYQTELDISHGLILDVLPLDGYPSSVLARKKQLFWATIYSLYRAQLVPQKHGKLITLVAKIALRVIPSKKTRYRIWRYAEKQMSKYHVEECTAVTELCSGPRYMMNKYPQIVFKKAIYKQFEGYMMPIPIGYDTYLKIAFGDYMKLPPKEKRVAHHDVVICDLDRSYKEYKGKFYCVKGK